MKKFGTLFLFCVLFILVSYSGLIWADTQLPNIIIHYPKDPNNAYNEAALVSDGVKVEWETDKGGTYTVKMVDWLDPNNTDKALDPSVYEDPNRDNVFMDKVFVDPNIYGPSFTPFGDSNAVIQKKHLERCDDLDDTTERVCTEGVYIIGVFWDPNQESLINCCKLFTFKYDNTPPTMTKPRVTTGAQKLILEWDEAKDKLAGVAEYRIWHEKIAEGEDPNDAEFTANDYDTVTGKTEYTIDGVASDQLYKIGIAAIDYAGNESEKCIGDGTTKESKGLADLSGEKGGCFLMPLR